MKKILAVLGLLFCITVFAEQTKEQHYVIRYDTGNTYDVKLREDSITWSGIRGVDRGHTETDAIKRKLLSNNIEVLQWNEKSGAFVTLVLDRKNHRSISSGRDKNDNWLTYGVVETVAKS